MKYVFVDDIDPNGTMGKILAQVKPDSKVLECGCASGYMTKYMKEHLGCAVSIIEYDAGGFNNAIQYACDGLCTDLMQNEWVEKYKDERFDYILFADVLEHLRDPMQVLKHAVSMLADDGMILVSLPNVGHNDVLVKLLTGYWDYTSVGLLDDTHIHFWGINNLDAFFTQAGLCITVKDCLIVPTARTEQYAGISFPADENIYATIKNRPEGEIYQFILSLQKVEYVKNNRIVQTDLFPEATSSSLKSGSLQEILDMQVKTEYLSQECKKLEEIIKEQKAFLEHRTEEVRFRDEEIQKREEIIQDQRAFLAHRTEEVRFRDEEIQRQSAELQKKNEELQQKNEELNCTRQHETSLQAELDAIKNSRTWRLAQGFTKAVRVFVPAKRNKD